MPFGSARRLDLIAIARIRRPMAAVNLSVADMIVKTKPHRITRNQSTGRRPTG
jgi:hypothetical protein